MELLGAQVKLVESLSFMSGFRDGIKRLARDGALSKGPTEEPTSQAILRLPCTSGSCLQGGCEVCASVVPYIDKLIILPTMMFPSPNI